MWHCIGMRSASKTIARCARWERTGSTFRSELCSQGPSERLGSFLKAATSGTAAWAAHLWQPVYTAGSSKPARGCFTSKCSAQFACVSAATTAARGLQAAHLLGAMPPAVVRCSARCGRRALLPARALRPASHNWSAHADAQQQEAASPQVLRAGGLRRSVFSGQKGAGKRSNA